MKKDLYAIAYVITAFLIAGAVAYYIFFFQKGLFEDVNQDTDLIALSARQEAYGQQITKAAVGMGYSENERNFLIFQSELSRIVPQWESVHKALIEGSEELQLSAPEPTSEYRQLQEDLKYYYSEMSINANNLLSIEFTRNVTDVNYLSLRGSIETLLQTIRKYQVASQNVTDYFVNNSQITKQGFSIIEYIIIGGMLALLLMQGVFIFRPMVKLASDNYLSANKAFQVVKKSEQQLKVSYAKQKHINKPSIVIILFINTYFYKIFI